MLGSTAPVEVRAAGNAGFEGEAVPENVIVEAPDISALKVSRTTVPSAAAEPFPAPPPSFDTPTTTRLPVYDACTDNVWLPVGVTTVPAVADWLTYSTTAGSLRTRSNANE